MFAEQTPLLKKGLGLKHCSGNAQRIPNRGRLQGMNSLWKVMPRFKLGNMKASF
jgi:hypothetical protein